MTTIEAFQPALFGIVAGAIYGLIWFARARAEDETEEFDPTKLAATLIVGAAVGASLGLANQEITQAGIAEQLAAYAGVIALVEGVLKSIRDGIGDTALTP